MAAEASGVSRRAFLRLCAAAGVAGPLLACARSGRRAGAQAPSLLLILADDLGYESLGCNGGTSYATPRLDALAAGGMRFTHCYSTPLCTPSRVQLVTGQYPFRTGFSMQMAELPRERRVLAPQTPNLARVLSDAGYATAVAGKWQLARFDDHPVHARDFGFDEHFLWTERWGDEYTSRYWSPSIWRDGRLAAELAREDVFGPDEETAFLIDFMRRHRERPFFAFYPMTLPHLPYVAVPGWDPASEHGGWRQRRWQRFAAMVGYLDVLVGRLVSALDATGLRERTLVLFSSDNGNASIIASRLGDALVRGAKGESTDRGTHVPLLASWPGTTPAGGVCDDLVDLSDLFPTLAALADAAPPPGHRLDGRSFAPALRGEAGSPRDWVHIQLRDTRALRSRRWKLYADGRLYDLESDPEERQPIGAAEGGEAAAGARRSLEAVFAELG